jgi:hypothetical protein
MAAVVALAFLAVLALHGERPEPGMVGFKAAGLLTAFAPEDARVVEVSRAGEVWRFRRDGKSWRAVQAPRPVLANAADRIDSALRLLRDTGPLRVLSAHEAAHAAPSDYALGPDALRVTVLGPDAATFAIVFGAANPLGLARYVRIDGVDGVPLLPAYVAETWEQTIGTTAPR